MDMHFMRFMCRGNQFVQMWWCSMRHPTRDPLKKWWIKQPCLCHYWNPLKKCFKEMISHFWKGLQNTGFRWIAHHNNYPVIWHLLMRAGGRWRWGHFHQHAICRPRWVQRLRLHLHLLWWTNWQNDNYWGNWFNCQTWMHLKDNCP